MSKSIQVIGPFITNYSLARTNRGLAKALSKVQDLYKTYLYGSVDQLDKYPDDSDLNKFPYIKSLWSKDELETDIAIYSNFPKEGIVNIGYSQIKAKTKTAFVAWEESIYPKIWVDEINQNLHGVFTISSFVKDILKKNGIKVPIFSTLIGIDDAMLVNPTAVFPLQTKKKFKFLHISSARKRKGVDVLLKAYFSQFSKDDDVCLVIKSFPGPDNMVPELLSELQNENSPEVEHITSPDLTDLDMVNLIHACDCSVYPSRAEGFGLPIAESMYHGKPVIATNYSGYLDFANESNAYLIDYKLVNTTDSEMVNLGAKWAEPDATHLAKTMKYLFENIESEEVTQKVNLAKEVANELTWQNTAKKILPIISDLEKISHLKTQNAGVISFLNDDDGVGEYTADLYSNVEDSFNNFFYISNKDIDARKKIDASNVIRTWESGETSFQETLKFIQEYKLQHIHIQYHSGVNFAPESLDYLLMELARLEVNSYVTLHAVKGKGFNIGLECKNLHLAKSVFIHNKEDFDSVPTDNKVLLYHPRKLVPYRSKSHVQNKLELDSYNPIIITHGKLVLQKIDLESVLESIKILKKDYPNILLIAMNAVVASNSSAKSDFDKLQEVVREFNLEENVLFVPDFLSEEEIFILLQVSDIALFPYKDVGESASAAVSKSLATLTPTITTDIKMFSEFTNEVLKIKDTNPTNISLAIDSLTKDLSLKNDLIKNSREFIEEYSFAMQAVRTLSYF
ncbi:glycosyltransferase [Candidatus Dojkabacteria bacterium]|uniref:Glycosyltransferase n=1 Tax=Candidatus Dojkabacteria bacterium TaxID=2099670 RepID=A0A955IA51_9BACT|nr:glycosyltransferase [Candidatus Dojkabacteria bacterium]